MSCHGAILCLSATVSVACSHTIYDFFPDEGNGEAPGSGGDCSSGECTTSGTGGDSGETTTDTGTGGGASTATGGTQGSGGNSDSEETAGVETGATTDSLYEPASCLSDLFPNSPPLFSLRFVDSGNCIAQGEEVALQPDITGNSIVTKECTQEDDEHWVILPFPYARAYRNQSSNMNLEVRFASPEAGTPVVLFAPHGSYNQRFARLDENDDGFLLSARHIIEAMCLTEVDGAVEIWPCNPAGPGQRIELVACSSFDTGTE